MDHATVLLVLALVVGFFMAWAVGANDVANAMGTSVGSGVLSIKQAIVLAAIFEALGAFLGSGAVTNTIRHNLIDISFFIHQPMLLAVGMLASLMAAATWLIVATYFAWPVSTTHCIVGAVVGFAAMGLGLNHVQWLEVLRISVTWVVSPLVAGLGSYALFRMVHRLVLSAKAPMKAVARVLPYFIFVVVALVLDLVVHEGFSLFGWVFTPMKAWGSIAVVGMLITAVLRMAVVRRFALHAPESQSRTELVAKVESVFGVLTIFTACAMAFAHGANDVANAIGPLATVVHIAHYGQVTLEGIALPVWLVGLGAVGVMAGLAMYGYRVIETVGGQITALTPSRGFSAQMATAATVLAASAYGLPVSTTQTLVGAVLGVGMARGISALNMAVVRRILWSWAVTLPAGALLSIGYFTLLRMGLLG